MSSIKYITKKSRIALVDCNSFYVSCERLFNPKIQKKAVVVLSNNDGCVISRSKEAKEIGIKMGEPYFKVKELVKRNKRVAANRRIFLSNNNLKSKFNKSNPIFFKLLIILVSLQS